MEGSNLSPSEQQRPLLIILGGLPGTGKTTLGRHLASRLGATYLRIDSIEQAICDAAPVRVPINEEGYSVACAIAEDNLRLGRTVIADSVNPCQQSRDAWLGVAQRVDARAAEVEIICSDAHLHRHRVESRVGDIRGLQLPSWETVTARAYEPWTRAHIVLDTAHCGIAQSAEDLYRALAKSGHVHKAHEDIGTKG